MLRTKRSIGQVERERERRRMLVLEAAHSKKEEELGDRLLADIIASVPRTTPALIAEVLEKVRNSDETEAELLQTALDQSTMLKMNLDGMEPEQMWSDPVRELWADTMQTLVQQSSRWKVTPIVMVHPYCGKLAVAISLCGKCRPQNEYERMKRFAISLRDGMEELVSDIHPVRDVKTGRSLSKEETREILMDVSKEMEANGELSEYTESCSEEGEDGEDDQFDKYEKEVEVESNDWTSGKPRPDLPARLTNTPPQPLANSLSSTKSSFSSPLDGIEPPKATAGPTAASETSSPLLTRTRVFPDGTTQTFVSDRSHGRTLFPTPTPERVVTVTPPAHTSTMVPEPTASPILKQASESGVDLSRGYSVIQKVIPFKGESPRKPKKPRNSDAFQGRKDSRKKRAVSSPNYPNAKTHRRMVGGHDFNVTQQAIADLQLKQANQNDVLQQVADQMNALTQSLMEMNSRRHT